MIQDQHIRYGVDQLIGIEARSCIFYLLINYFFIDFILVQAVNIPFEVHRIHDVQDHGSDRKHTRVAFFLQKVPQLLGCVVKLIPSSLILTDEIIWSIHVWMIDNFEGICIYSSYCVLFDMPVLFPFCSEDCERLAELTDQGPQLLLSQHDVLVLSCKKVVPKTFPFHVNVGSIAVDKNWADGCIVEDLLRDGFAGFDDHVFVYLLF